MLNLPVIFRNMVSNAGKIARKGLFMAKVHSPELCIGAGIGGFGLTCYGFCKATNKVHDIMEIRDNELHAIQVESPDNYTDEKMAEIKKWAKKEIIKAYIPPFTTGVGSVILILTGYRILNGRFIATAAAYKTLEAGFERYRGNVREEFGSETDWRMLNSISKEDWEKAQKEREENKLIKAENEKRFRKKPLANSWKESTSDVFDKYSQYWKYSWTGYQVLQYLKRKQQEANDMLNVRGHLFLNEVYDILGLDRRPEGQVVGWLKDRNNPNKVDFGIDDLPEDRIREIIGAQCNEDIWVRLRFNTDGIIYTMIDMIEV